MPVIDRTTILIRRGLEADRTAYTPLEGELIYVTDTNKLYAGDGSTAGGVLIGPGSATISDGDKGDITVSGSGATWTIDSGVVTYAKLQDISATQRLLGRNTAGAGDAEEVSISTVLDWIGSAQGSVLYRGASGWAVLAPGTSGQFLQTQGAGANPQWATASGGSSSPTVLNPAQLTAWQNNYAPTGIVPGCVIRVDADTSYPFITGISATGFSDGDSVYIVNDGSNVFGFKDQETGSTAGNRFAMGEDAILLPGTACQFQYDGGASRWRLLTPSILLSEIQRGRYVGYYRNDFLQKSNDSVLSYWTSGSGASHNLNQFNGRFGVVEHNTGTTSTGTAYLYGVDLANPNWAVKGGAGMWFEWCYRVEDLSDGTNRYGVNIGYLDSFNYDSAADSVLFRYRDDVNSGKWQIECKNAGSGTTTADSGVTVAADTWYVLRAFIHSSSRVDFWINGNFVGSITTNIPINRDMGLGMILTKSAGTTSRTTYSDYAIFGQVTNALG